MWDTGHLSQHTTIGHWSHSPTACWRRTVTSLSPTALTALTALTAVHLIRVTCPGKVAQTCASFRSLLAHLSSERIHLSNLIKIILVLKWFVEDPAGISRIRGLSWLIHLIAAEEDGQQAAVTEIHECTDECSARPCKYARRNLTLDAEKGGERRLEGVVETWA